MYLYSPTSSPSVWANSRWNLTMSPSNDSYSIQAWVQYWCTRSQLEREPHFIHRGENCLHLLVEIRRVGVKVRHHAEHDIQDSGAGQDNKGRQLILSPCAVVVSLALDQLNSAVKVGTYCTLTGAMTSQ